MRLFSSESSLRTTCCSRSVRVGVPSSGVVMDLSHAAKSLMGISISSVIDLPHTFTYEASLRRREP